MTQQDDITQRVLTDDELDAIHAPMQNYAACNINIFTYIARAIESALLSKLRAPVAPEPFRAAFANGVLPATRFHELWESAAPSKNSGHTMLEDLTWQVGKFASLVAAEVRAPVADERAARAEYDRGFSNGWDSGNKHGREQGFNGGVCVALQVITTHDQGTIWRDIVSACDTRKMLDYAANVEPDEWELAGFKKYARMELNERKPRRRYVPAAPQAALASAPVAEPRLEWSAKALYDAIKDVLLNHRLSNLVDEDGEFFPLVDHLCSQDDKTIESGEFEIALICDAIYNDVLTKSAPVAGEPNALELRGVPETVKEGDGSWRSCTGCHELNEGRDTGPYSAVLGCHLGQGCSECGGIGAVWDSTDYQAMADDMARGMGQSVSAAPQASAEPTHKPAMSVAEFCAEAGRLGLTADTLAAQLSQRPEFADCLPQADKDGAEQALKDLVTHGVSVQRIAPADFMADRQPRAGDGKTREAVDYPRGGALNFDDPAPASAEGIRSPYNACMHRNECRAMLDRQERAGEVPSDDALAQIGYAAAIAEVGWGEAWADLESDGDTQQEWRAGAKAIRAALSAPQAEQGDTREA